MPNVSCLRSAMWAFFARPVFGDVAVLKGLTWLRVGVTLLLAGVFALSVASAWSFLCPSCTDQAFIPKYVQNLRDFSLSLFPPMLALTVADNLRPTTLGRTATLVTGFVAGTLVAWLLHLVVDFGNPFALTYNNVLGSIPNGLLPITTGLIALVYFKRRRDLEIAAALHEAGLARIDLQKRTLESNLQAMQARVEPGFLLGTLRSVGALYETDPVAADRTLDHLITYLRAALPQMRSTSSTVGAELDLVRAYLGIQQIRAGGRLDFAIDAPDDLLDPPFPPMVLLPLVEEALNRGRGRGGEAEHTELRIAVGVDDGKLKITLADSGPPDHAQGALDNVRARLAALYGNDATLVLRRRECGAAETKMEIPYERAETGDV